MIKKTQSIEGKNPTCLAFSHPNWFLPYVSRKGRLVNYNVLEIIRKYCKFSMFRTGIET